ncbi:uncharacterized protein METZ01_LOCUS169460 [marine metagenome]|uniref:Uncharacterized protein n=1 Tax=marine metagenome TaxID=408172 RepID=A0A382BS10_9ZZZZ
MGCLEDKFEYRIRCWLAKAYGPKTKKAPAITGIMAGAGTSANWGITEAYCRNIVLPYVRHKI